MGKLELQVCDFFLQTREGDKQILSLSFAFSNFAHYFVWILNAPLREPLVMPLAIDKLDLKHFH